MTNGVQRENTSTHDPSESQAFVHDYYTHREGVAERLARLEENVKTYDNRFMSRSEFWEFFCESIGGRDTSHHIYAHSCSSIDYNGAG